MSERIKVKFAELVEAIAVLRSPEGCPWDKEQTHDSLKQYSIEETYELVEAIENGDPDKIEDELGDVLLQVVLHSQIATEAGQFDIADVCSRITSKLIRRHPHVFSGLEVSGIDEIWKNWESIKSCEPGYEERKSALDGVPKTLPALMRAAKMSKKAAKTGFDWPEISAVVDKLKEETCELEAAIKNNDKENIKEEIGDLLFTVVNIARFEGVDPEEALRDMLAKFQSRFNKIEHHANKTGRDINDMTLDEMDKIWNESKS